MGEHNLHERAGVLPRLNKAYKMKVHCYKTPDLLLRSGTPLVLHDLMKTTTLVLWLNRLHDLRLPITEDMTEDVPLPQSSSEEESREQSTSGAYRAAENLQTLKAVELCLRHERPGMLELLPHRAKHLLTLARATPLDPPDDFPMLDLPFVFARLGRLFRDAGLLLHPTIYGPFLLGLTDPLGKIVVEWDKTWVLYPPYRRLAQEDFTLRKHRLLKAEGWTILQVPHQELEGQVDRAAQVDFLRRFAKSRGLQHLLSEVET